MFKVTRGDVVILILDYSETYQTFNNKTISIYIYQLSFLPCVSTSPVAADGPMGMIFGMWMCFGDRLLIFVKSGSKVKGQGQKSIKICLFWVDFGHRGYIWDYSEPRRVGGGGYYWQHAIYIYCLKPVGYSTMGLQGSNVKAYDNKTALSKSTPKYIMDPPGGLNFIL